MPYFTIYPRRPATVGAAICRDGDAILRGFDPFVMPGTAEANLWTVPPFDGTRPVTRDRCLLSRHSTIASRGRNEMTWQLGLYSVAVLIPLAAFTVEAIFIRQLKRFNAYLATGAIGFSCLLSLIGFVDYTIESKFFAPRRINRQRRRARQSRAWRRGHAETGHKPLVWSGSFDWVILGAGRRDRGTVGRGRQASLSGSARDRDRQSERP